MQWHSLHPGVADHLLAGRPSVSANELAAHGIARSCRAGPNYQERLPDRHAHPVGRARGPKLSDRSFASPRWIRLFHDRHTVLAALVLVAQEDGSAAPSSSKRADSSSEMIF